MDGVLRVCLFLLTFAFCTLPSAFCLSPRPPLYVSFIDQLTPQGFGPSIRGLDERRRGPAFEIELQKAADAGKLPPLISVNKDLTLPSTRVEEKPVPPGATLLRVYLTQWSDTRLGGFAASEVLCRVFVEVVRDGRTVQKLGPFLGRTAYDMTAVTTAEDRQLQFRQAAREAIADLAHALPR